MFGFIKDLVTSVVGGVNTVAGAVGGYFGGAVGAVATTMVQSAAAGMVIGAATNAIRGEDILEGAMKGAAYAGLAGGVMEGLNQYMGADTTLLSAGSDKQRIADNLISDHRDPAMTMMSNSASSTSSSALPSGNTGGLLNYAKTDSGGKVIGGILTGMSDAYIAAESDKSAKETAEKTIQANKDLLKQQYDQSQAAIAATRPGTAPVTQTAIINRNDIGQWWADHLTERSTALRAIREAE